ncbi:flagellar assembly factor FliW [Virgisporangium aliadipatigenens]|uniref:Flagellar assembly factor FliW n=1 Tax=Virgisporangium aliadipatigenens TaxID=741659 RepID=A0A8J3YW85_9ACTN|nr:flagellar assembly protein FliW [Virgisporangium aliadipatigenens]GIJ50843.1 flagellar assembly factor FliW [Virgisporangium aliadipatigenens]
MSGTAARTLEAEAAFEVPVIEFVAPLAGFPAERKFVLVRLDDAGVLFALTSVDDPELRFLVVPPAPFFPDYTPEIDDEALRALGVHDDKHLLTLLVVTAGETAHASTANLMAPIVLHEESRRAVQLVLSGSGLPVRASLMSG